MQPSSDVCCCVQQVTRTTTRTTRTTATTMHLCELYIKTAKTLEAREVYGCLLRTSGGLAHRDRALYLKNQRANERTNIHLYWGTNLSMPVPDQSKTASFPIFQRSQPALPTRARL